MDVELFRLASLFFSKAKKVLENNLKILIV